ncbi:MAG TPA: vitamin K epoxide reductase family protein [Polyangiaceae bacterium]|nr:vitamin K epoxide reductase family protein [Polyangiaceae bacterium]
MTTPRSQEYAAPIALLCLCTLGAVVSGLSTWDHVRFRISGGVALGACAALIDSGCKSAHASPIAELWGVPMSHFGTAFYIAGASLAILVLVLRAGQIHARASLSGVASIITAMGLGAVAYSVYLATLLVRSGEACPFCIALYAVNVGMLLVGLVWWGREHWALTPAAVFAPTAVATIIGGGLFALSTPFLLGAIANGTRIASVQPSVSQRAALPAFAFPVEHVTRVQAMLDAGISGTPALVVNGELKSVGKLLDVASIQSILLSSKSEVRP